jgi:hypothetical protein
MIPRIAPSTGREIGDGGIGGLYRRIVLRTGGLLDRVAHLVCEQHVAAGLLRPWIGGVLRIVVPDVHARVDPDVDIGACTTHSVFVERAAGVGLRLGVAVRRVVGPGLTHYFCR